MENITLLKENLGEENVLLDEDMSKHTSFKTGGKADIFVKVKDIEKLRYVLQFSKENKLPLFILGNGSNLLVRDKGIRGIVCKIEINRFEVVEKENEVFVTAGSGNKNASLSQKLLDLGICGFEFASRNSRNNWRSNKNECWCIWKRNERYCIFNKIYGIRWKYKRNRFK